MSNSVATTNPWLLGINLSGAEYGDPATGRMYYDYIYPNNVELDRYAASGARVVRIPFSLERLDPTPNGTLDPTQLGFLDGLVAHAAADGMKVILDPHNFGSIYGADVGTGATNAEFADFWSKLANHYATTTNVIFGLMNEPHTQTASEWLGSANLAIAAIRQSGATQEILVPGTWWDTGATWDQSGNAAALGSGVVDPSHNYAIEVHQYLDVDDSGTHDTVVSATIGVERLQGVTQWAEATGNKLFLGEFGVASDALSVQAMSNMLTYMQAHADVWQGGTYWAAGPWMGNYMFSAETPDGTPTSQMDALRQFMSLPALDSPIVTPQSTTNTSGPSSTAPIAPVDQTVVQTIKVFRFFDTKSGTQFLTGNPDEVNSLITTRPDLIYEGVGINGLATGDHDPDAIMVHRFFDQTNGTHFYTASDTETAQISKLRPDLVLESSVFFEHRTPQATDTPVYRFFETETGNHFFTSTEAERSMIAATRPDMVFEGIAFYAPHPSTG